MIRIGLNFLLWICLICHTAAQDYGVDGAVITEVVTAKSPPTIQLKWTLRSDVQDYILTKRSPQGTETTQTLSGSSTGFTDTNVVVGLGYEYRIRATRLVGKQPPFAYGNIFAGIDLPMVETRGRVILAVDERVEVSLENELRRWEEDVQASGWTAERYSVPVGTTVVEMKQEINRRAVLWPPGVEGSLFLFGHLPMAYSGNIYPDGHPDHRGAWPADGFFADISGVWTDTSVNNIAATRLENQNVIGDGKFDQGILPASIQLMSGRVDLSRLPAFGLSEIELLRRYLNKNHAFRTGVMLVNSRGVVDDNFASILPEGPAASARFGMTGAMGANAVTNGEFVGGTTGQSALMGVAFGPGGYNSISGAFSTADCVSTPPQVMFSLVFGSYFGDFDTTDNVMRAILAADGCSLAAAWTGRPQWQLHHLAMGYPLGHAARLTQRCSNLQPYNMGLFAKSSHLALLGDPTLMLFPVKTVENVSAENAAVSWGSSPDAARLGFHIYRRISAEGAWERQTVSPISTNQWTDPSPTGFDSYLVKSVRLEKTASGTFVNASQGVMATPVLPAVRIDAAQATASEYPHTNATLRINRNHAVGDLQVHLSAPSGGASEGADFTSIPRSIVIPHGHYFVEIEIAALSDAAAEGPETFSVSIENDTAYVMAPAASTALFFVEDHPYESWCHEHFGATASPALTTPSGDPDKDGVVNLLEFGVGSDPLVASVSCGLAPESITELQCSFRFACRANLPGVSWECEASNNMFNWTNHLAGMTQQIAASTGTIDTWEITLPRDGQRCFVRMKLVTAPDFFP